MVQNRFNDPASSLVRGLTRIGGRAAAAGVRPLSGAIGAAAGAGMDLERRAVDRLIESGELERLLAGRRLQTVAAQVLDSDGATRLVGAFLDSDGARRLVDAFFDSGVFDQFVARLLASDALWELVDTIAASPSVSAAISQQGLGFADQVGDQVRNRSRNADVWLERAARRLVRRGPGESPPAPDPAH